MKTIKLDNITVQAEQVGPSGGAVWHRTGFVAYSDRPLTNEEVQEIQAELGWHPAGYGCFYMEHIPGHRKEQNGKIVTSWNCQGSCD